jgi:hypothetical protein
MNTTPYLKKITEAKRAGGVAQVIEHLSSKYKILNSNPSNATEQITHSKTSIKQTFKLISLSVL